MSAGSNPVFRDAICDPEAGWRHYHDQAPPANVRQIEIWRESWPGPMIVNRDQMHSEMNAIGLFWRLP